MDQYSNTKIRKKKNKKGFYFLIGITIIFLLIMYGYSRYQYLLENPVDANNIKNISFVINAEKDNTLSKISEKLYKNNIITDKTTFEIYVRLNNLDRKLKAGRFLLNQAMTIPEIVEKLSDSTQSEAVVTIPEGFTVYEIDQRLTNLELISEGEFIKAVRNFQEYDKYPFLNKEKMENLPYPLEGFLFPDTYFISSTNFSSEDLISLMLNNFQKKLNNGTLKPNSNQEKDFFDIIVMASIIEKEVNKDEDRPIVSGILWKRLEENWQLGADATLLYLKKDRTINFEDLKEDSPYNTRKFRGLPPGPIANPGLNSIGASMYPKKTPYYYYLHRSDNGEIMYSETNEEHNLKKQKYL